MIGVEIRRTRHRDDRPRLRVQDNHAPAFCLDLLNCGNECRLRQILNCAINGQRDIRAWNRCLPRTRADRQGVAIQVGLRRDASRLAREQLIVLSLNSIETGIAARDIAEYLRREIPRWIDAHSTGL